MYGTNFIEIVEMIICNCDKRIVYAMIKENKHENISVCGRDLLQLLMVLDVGVARIIRTAEKQNAL